MNNYQQDAALLLQLVGKRKHRCSIALHDTYALCA